ncbi:4878_t:CDS:2, partial [Entrophospora sp. SA101]
PLIVKADEDPIVFRQELNFYIDEEFLVAVDTTDELEQDKLKEDLLYIASSITSVSLVKSDFTITSVHHRKYSPPLQAPYTASITSVSNGTIISLQFKPHQIKLAMISNLDISV